MPANNKKVFSLEQTKSIVVEAIAVSIEEMLQPIMTGSCWEDFDFSRFKSFFDQIPRMFSDLSITTSDGMHMYCDATSFRCMPLHRMFKSPNELFESFMKGFRAYLANELSIATEEDFLNVLSDIPSENLT